MRQSASNAVSRARDVSTDAWNCTAGYMAQKKNACVQSMHAVVEGAHQKITNGAHRAAQYASGAKITAQNGIRATVQKLKTQAEGGTKIASHSVHQVHDAAQRQLKKLRMQGYQYVGRLAHTAQDYWHQLALWTAVQRHAVVQAVKRWFERQDKRVHTGVDQARDAAGTVRVQAVRVKNGITNHATQLGNDMQLRLDAARQYVDTSTQRAAQRLRKVGTDFKARLDDYLQELEIAINRAINSF